MNKTSIKYFIVLALLPVFIACQNPSDTVYMAPGTGLVSITINKVDTARTILPDPKVANFAVLELAFTSSGGGTTQYFDRTNTDPTITINGLVEGTYDLVVTAYADIVKTLAAAQGSVPGIVVSAGAITPASVTLYVTFGEGDGTFSWDITYPSGVTATAMTITPINEASGSPVIITPVAAGSTPLASGEYRIEFSLRDSQGRTAELIEILHVYKNVTSNFTHEFKESNFHFLKVKQVIFPEDDTEAYVSFDGLTSSNVVYLVKVNTNTTVVSAANTGNVLLSSPPSLPPSASPPQNRPDIPELPRMGHPEADKFNINPPPVLNRQKGPQGSLPQAAALSEGATRDFWVEEYYNNGNWVKKQATLMAQGEHSNVWVMDGTMYNYASQVAVMFDTIYLAETNILGYEYGGGPGGDGGVDGDLKIQILFYPIVKNSSGTVAASGYFWPKDFYPENYLSDAISNEAEIFYMDSSQTLAYSYSTLAHEFQHMIYFNRKSVDKGLALTSSTTWYNEMLSSMTEDVMANIIGLDLTNYSHPVHQKMIGFLQNYAAVGLTEWGGTSNNYAMVLSFGAYLMRNYGGVELLSKIMANNAVGTDSITAALNEIYEGMTFEQALARFGEALVFSSPEESGSVVTFNKDINYTKINPLNGVSYDYFAPAIDVWAGKWPSQDGFTGYTPYIFDLSQRELRPSSISVHTSYDTWKNITTGHLTITLQKPANGVMFFLMVK